MQNFLDLLKAHPYPGRGIMLGKTADGAKSVVVYFIMGRSENSRNRIFEITDDGIRTKAFDESKMVDPSLIIYAPVRVVGSDVIVTNARHYEALTHALDSIHRVQDGLQMQLSGDFLSQDLRECIHHLSDIVGEVSTDSVLQNIFKHFCIGK